MKMREAFYRKEFFGNKIMFPMKLYFYDGRGFVYCMMNKFFILWMMIQIEKYVMNRALIWMLLDLMWWKSRPYKFYTENLSIYSVVFLVIRYSLKKRSLRKFWDRRNCNLALKSFLMKIFFFSFSLHWNKFLSSESLKKLLLFSFR